MANAQPELDSWQEEDAVPQRFQRLQRIPSPFVWAPESPARIRVALIDDPSRRHTGALETLRSTGHHVVRYDSADQLLADLQSLSHALDVVVIDGTERPRVASRALERIRRQEGSIPIVLITTDDSELLADADCWAVEEVLELPVHPVALRAAVAAAASCAVTDVVVDWLAAND